jgi:CheY-like chemotaxis protein
MPEMDGKEATKTVRRQQGLNGTRLSIVAMTAYVTAGDREQCVAASLPLHHGSRNTNFQHRYIPP